MINSLFVPFNGLLSKWLFLSNTNSKLYRSMKMHSTLLLYLFLLYVVFYAQGSFKIAIIAHYTSCWLSTSTGMETRKQHNKTIAVFVGKEVINQLNMIYHCKELKDSWVKDFDIFVFITCPVESYVTTSLDTIRSTLRKVFPIPCDIPLVS